MVKRRIDFARIADAALGIAQQLLAEWLPDGQAEGHDWLAINPTRADSSAGSFSVRIDTGGFYDHATGEKGKDYVGLYAYLHGKTTMGKAALALAERLGIDPYLPADVAKDNEASKNSTVAEKSEMSQCSTGNVANNNKRRERKPRVEHPRVQVFPIPADAPRPDLVWSTKAGGHKPVAVYPYRELDGSPLGIVARYMVKNAKGVEEKETVTWTCWRNISNGALTWQDKFFPDPLPLYNGESLAARPTDPVLIVEGEKCVDYAKRHVPGMVAISWPGGGAKAKRGAWEDLAGRDVILWPDADTPGLEAMAAVAGELTKHGARSTLMVDLQRLAAALDLKELPAGFDIADIANGGPWLSAFLTGKANLKPPTETTSPAVPSAAATAAGITRPGGPVGPVLGHDAPYTSAQVMLAQAFAWEDEAGKAPTLRRYGGEWFQWDNNAFRLTGDETLRARVWRFLESARAEKPDGTTVPFSPEPKHVNGVMDALGALVQVPASAVMPCWLDDDGRPIEKPEGRPRADKVVSFFNGLLDLEKLLDLTRGKELSFSPDIPLLPHSPRWFSSNVLPYNYDKDATCPNWEKFIHDCSKDSNGTVDPTWERAIAKWFGLNLTSDTSYQKVAMFYGAKGSGKSTLARMLRAMIGEFNICAPRMSEIAGQFGLWSFIGKQAAIFFDVRLGKQTDNIAVLEQLLAISGEDPRTIDRKNREPITVRLKTRITFVGNELLNLPDASGALDRRLLLFPFRVSHIGTEDRALETRLMAELPGVANWSLLGLRLLTEDRQLTGPATGESDKRELARIASPIGAWSDDCCEHGPGMATSIADLFTAWKAWCEENGHHAGASCNFSAKLCSAFPGLQRDRTSQALGKVRILRGIRILPQAQQIIQDL